MGVLSLAECGGGRAEKASWRSPSLPMERCPVAPRSKFMVSNNGLVSHPAPAMVTALPRLPWQAGIVGGCSRGEREAGECCPLTLSPSPEAMVVMPQSKRLLGESLSGDSASLERNHMKTGHFVNFWMLVAVSCLLFQGAALARDDEATTRAKVLFADGTTQYNLARFEEALGKFQDAYLAKAEPGLLINIGQCYRMLGNHKQAVYSYRRFLDGAPPDHPMRTAITELVASEEEVIKKGNEAALPPIAVKHAEPVAPTIIAPAPVAPSAIPTVKKEVASHVALKASSTPVYKKWWLWAVVGGVVAVGAGVGIGVAYSIPSNAATPPNATSSLPVNF